MDKNDTIHPDPHAGTIDKRIAHLESVLASLERCTQPIDGHTDPLSINDCWNEVRDTIAAIKSGCRHLCFATWTEAYRNIFNQNRETFDSVSSKLGVNQFHYLKSDNQPIRVSGTGTLQEPEFVLWMDEFKRLAHNSNPKEYGFGTQYMETFFKEKYYDHNFTPEQAWTDYTTQLT